MLLTLFPVQPDRQGGYNFQSVIYTVVKHWKTSFYDLHRFAIQIYELRSPFPDAFDFSPRTGHSFGF
jgi:hypothetical protein